MTSDAAGSTLQSPKSAKKESASASPEPIVVDMGKKNRKQVRKLRKGRQCKLMDRVAETIEHLRENGAITAGAQPIVIVVKERSRRRGGRMAKMWGLG
jgi:hypothetical protein